MLATFLTTAAAAAALGLLGLIALGARWRACGLARLVPYALGLVVAAAGIAVALWDRDLGELFLTGAILIAGAIGAAVLKPDWSPPAQAFFGVLALVCVAFVAHAIDFTFSGELEGIAYPAAILFLLLEAFAFTLLLIGTHETLDTVARVRWRRRRETAPAPAGYSPFVSIHVPTHNEPPELVIETLDALGRLDYGDHEVIVLDNNTDDVTLWQPVEQRCAELGFRFVHLENWPGYKAGALNHGLEIADPRTEIIAVVDADFIVEPDFLRQSVGAFAAPVVGIVQTRQGFRSEPGNDYLRRLALTYRSFDEVSMPTRNERNAIIFAGTMGLLRKEALVEAGGWGEWCVTEDAELSLRIAARGWDSVYLEHEFGNGVMPLTFSGLKGQRFRWCLGGVQMLREHWRLMLSGRGRAPDGTELRLTRGQRFDYMAGALQWFQAPLSIIFAGLLLVGVIAWALGAGVTARPLAGLFLAVPTTLLVTSLLRAFWGLRERLGVSWVDAASAMAIFLSLTWAVALASAHGLSGRGVAFLRTPKAGGPESVRQLFAATRAETPLALLLGAAAVVAFLTRSGLDAVFLGVLCVWSALLFGTAPVVAFAAARQHLESPALLRRRAVHDENERAPIYLRPASLGWAGALAAVLLAILVPSIASGPGGSGIGDILRPPEAEDALADDPEEKQEQDRNASERRSGGREADNPRANADNRRDQGDGTQNGGGGDAGKSGGGKAGSGGTGGGGSGGNTLPDPAPVEPPTGGGGGRGPPVEPPASSPDHPGGGGSQPTDPGGGPPDGSGKPDTTPGPPA